MQWIHELMLDTPIAKFVSGSRRIHSGLLANASCRCVRYLTPGTDWERVEVEVACPHRTSSTEALVGHSECLAIYSTEEQRIDNAQEQVPWGKLRSAQSLQRKLGCRLAKCERGELSARGICTRELFLHRSNAPRVALRQLDFYSTRVQLETHFLLRGTTKN